MTRSDQKWPKVTNIPLKSDIFSQKIIIYSQLVNNFPKMCWFTQFSHQNLASHIRTFFVESTSVPGLGVGGGGGRAKSLSLFFASRQSSSTWKGNLEKKTDLACFLWQYKRLKQNSAGPERSPFFHFSGTNKKPIGGAVSASPLPLHQIGLRGGIYSVN